MVFCGLEFLLGFHFVYWPTKWIAVPECWWRFAADSPPWYSVLETVLSAWLESRPPCFCANFSILVQTRGVSILVLRYMSCGDVLLRRFFDFYQRCGRTKKCHSESGKMKLALFWRNPIYWAEEIGPISVKKCQERWEGIVNFGQQNAHSKCFCAGTNGNGVWIAVKKGRPGNGNT